MLHFKSLTPAAEKVLARIMSLEWLAPLLIRLFVGYFFFETGWAKLHNLDAFIVRFSLPMQWPNGFRRTDLPARFTIWMRKSVALTRCRSPISPPARATRSAEPISS